MGCENPAGTPLNGAAAQMFLHWQAFQQSSSVQSMQRGRAFQENAPSACSWWRLQLRRVLPGKAVPASSGTVT